MITERPLLARMRNTTTSALTVDRMVTLIGLGRVGKTTLALEVARRFSSGLSSQ
jgi:predicted ATPase